MEPQEGEEQHSDEDEGAGCCAKCCDIMGWVRQACTELGRLFCCPPVPSRIAAKLAFVPPPPHYDIREAAAGAESEPRYTLWLRSAMWGAEEFTQVPEFSVERDGFTLHVEWLRTSSRNFIPALFLQVPRARYTLIFSHGNGTDIGQMFDFFVHLALSLQVQILAYEYSGYGASSAPMPSERATIEDAEAAWACATQKHGVAPDRIVLYGQSVGSGPSCSLAGRAEFAPAGLILHSGMMSGLRVVMPLQRTLPVDPYPNIDIIKNVSCPVFVIHGVQDDVVPFHHGVQLHRAVAPALTTRPLWVRRGGHNNLVGFRVYYTRLAAFLESLGSGPPQAPTPPAP